MRLAVAVPLCLLAFSAQALAASDSQVRQQLDDFLTSYSQPYSKGDAQGVARFFASDAVYVDPMGNKHIGRQEVERTLAGVFKQIGPVIAFDASLDDARALGDNHAWAIGRSRLAAEKFPARTTHWTALYDKAGNNYEIKLLTLGIVPQQQPPTGSSTK